MAKDNNNFFEELNRITGSAFSTAASLRNEMTHYLKQQFQDFAENMELANKHDIELIKKALRQAREDISALEKQIQGGHGSTKKGSNAKGSQASSTSRRGSKDDNDADNKKGGRGVSSASSKESASSRHSAGQRSSQANANAHRKSGNDENERESQQKSSSSANSNHRSSAGATGHKSSASASENRRSSTH